MSLHALTGSKGDVTLKIQGVLKDKKISILVDSGSTHNFVSQNLVKQLQLRTDPCSTFQVIVANGEHIPCSNFIESVQWTMAGEDFKASANVIPLGGYDLILGDDWMSMVSPVTFDYTNETITIKLNEKRVILQQSCPTAKVQVQLNGSNVKQSQEEAYFLVQISVVENTLSSEKFTKLPPGISAILSNYKDLFAEPTELPPTRNQDHHIPLKPNSTPC